jgi:hypothetical protein
MQSFKQYLNEEREPVGWEVDSKLAPEEIVEQLDQHCKEGLKAITNGGLLFRGFGTFKLGKIVQVDSTNSFRTSKDTNNLYQSMMDASEALKQYPSRSKAIICSTSYSYASETFSANSNSARVVIPFDNTVIACSNSPDFFGEKIKSPLAVKLGTIESFTFSLERAIIKACEMQWEILTHDSIAKKLSITEGPKDQFLHYRLSEEELNQALTSVNPLLLAWAIANHKTTGAPATARFAKYIDHILEMLDGKMSKDEQLLYGLFTRYSKKRWTALSTLLMSPNTLNVKLKKFGSPLPKNVECWFVGKAFIFERSVFRGILKELKYYGLRINKRYTEGFNL